MTDIIYLPKNLPQEIGQSQLYIPRVGKVYGTGTYKTSFQVPHAWGMLALNGEATITVNGKQFLIRQGDLFIFPPQFPFDFAEDELMPFDYLWLDFHGTRVTETILKLAEGQPFVSCYGVGESLQEFAKDIVETFEFDNNSPFFCEYTAWQLVETVANHQPDNHNRQQPITEQAKLLIEQGARYQLKIETIANKLNISRSTLFRKFKEAYKISPKKYLDQQKIAYAEHLLLESRLPITEIAFQSGFDSLQQFYYTFRNFNQLPPAEFRKVDDDN